MNTLAITEVEIAPAQPAGTLEETADYMIAAMSSLLQLELVSRQATTTSQNDPAVVFTLGSPVGDTAIRFFITQWSDRASFMAYYTYSDPALEPLVDYVFSTYQR